MDNIIFRKSWFKTLKRWKPEQVYEFISLLERFVDGKDIEIIDERIMDFWDQVEPLLNSDLKKFNKVVERNRENGSKGGRPSKTQTNPNKPTLTQETHSVIWETQQNPKNLKEKEIEKEIEIENEIEKDIDSNNRTNILGDFDRNKFYNHNLNEIHHVMDSLKVSKEEAIDLHYEFIEATKSVFG